MDARAQFYVWGWFFFFFFFFFFFLNCIFLLGCQAKFFCVGLFFFFFFLSLLFTNRFYLKINIETPSLSSFENFTFINVTKETNYNLERVFLITQSLEIQKCPLVNQTFHLPVCWYPKLERV